LGDFIALSNRVFQFKYFISPSQSNTGLSLNANERSSGRLSHSMSESEDTLSASTSSSRSKRAAANKANERFGKLNKKQPRKKKDKEHSTAMAHIPQAIQDKLTREELTALQAVIVQAQNREPNQNGNQNENPQQQNGNGNQQPIILQMDEIVVRSPNPNIKIPKYIPDRMTAEHYLNEVKYYFASQGINQNLVASVSTIMDPATKSWFTHIKREGMTWEEFSEAFKAKYDTWFDKQRRMNYLVNRVQRDDEPTESFVWEIISSSKQVFPQEEVADAVRRCRAALTPKLRSLIPDLLVWTPEALIERCKSANHDIREGENRTGNTSNIPPLIQPSYRGNYQPYRGQRGSSYNQRGSSYNQRGSGWNNRGGYSNFQPSTNYRQSQPVAQPTHPQRSWTPINRINSRGASNATQPDAAVAGSSRTEGQRKPNITKCYNCNKLGHIARHCRNAALYYGHGSDRSGQPDHHHTPNADPHPNQHQSHQSKNEEGRDQ
jgi:hypothetical protein